MPGWDVNLSLHRLENKPSGQVVYMPSICFLARDVLAYPCQLLKLPGHTPIFLQVPRPSSSGYATGSFSIGTTRIGMSNSRRLGWFGQPSGAGGPSSGQPQGNIASSSSVARIPPPRLPTLLKLDLCLSPEDPRERRVYHPFSGVFHYQYGISRNARDWVLNNRYVQIWVGFTSLEPLYLRMEWLKRHPDWLRRHPPPRGFHQNM